MSRYHAKQCGADGQYGVMDWGDPVLAPLPMREPVTVDKMGVRLYVRDYSPRDAQLVADWMNGRDRPLKVSSGYWFALPHRPRS